MDVTATSWALPRDAGEWHLLWDRSAPFGATHSSETLLDLWGSVVVEHPDRTCVIYGDRALTVADIEAQARALAAALHGEGIVTGDRVALFLQNQPEFVVALLAAWQLGAVVVPINPMNRERELTALLTDSGASALVLLDELWPTAATVLGATAVEFIVLTTRTAYAEEPEARGPVDEAAGLRKRWFTDLVRSYDGAPHVGPTVRPADTALLIYTSGTTGPAKGAQITHGNVAFNAHNWRAVQDVGPDDVILGVAPLFHITGLMSAVSLALVVPAPLVLDFRFDAARSLTLIQEHRATCVVGATSVFIALLDCPGRVDHDISSLCKIISGGAPIPPAVIDRYELACGTYIHPAYGLTETTSVTLATPPGVRAPIDPDSGTVAVGVPVPGTGCRIVDANGADVAPGDAGEVLISGPHVMSGYWNNQIETDAAVRDGWLSTGDVGVADADGWVFLVDRKKDQINAAGYKVWPREVEDVLYEHPAVREAAVVGIPDEYRGETVKAFVSLRPGADVTTSELVEFARRRMAAYKYPRIVEIVDELPKTTSGKILRRSLRQSTLRPPSPED